VPPNFQRFLPFVLIAVVLLFVLPTLLKKHNSGPSAGTRAALTIDAMNLIDKGEQSHNAARGRFTLHLADLLPLNTRLASDLAIGLVRARSDNKLTAQSCLVLKSGSGVKCPAPVA
jgi:hypothetical protein